MKATDRIDIEYVHQREIDPSLVDIYGHVNHARYLELFEESRWAMVENQGFGPDKVEELKLGPVILEAQIRYKKELKPGDLIEIRTQVSPIVKKIGHIFQRMTFKDSGLLVSEVDLVYGIMSMESRRLINPPKAWLEAVKLPVIEEE